MSRYEENMKSTKFNNTLIHANKHDRNRVYAILRSTRNSAPKLSTDVLETPVGTFYGNDILEGFAADAEHLGKPSGDNGNFDREFYNLCVLDNLYIFEFKGEDQVRIPTMNLTDLEDILEKKMKLGKACDYYQLTVEHLRFCGGAAKICILRLLNNIIENINYLTCPQVKVGLGSTKARARR